MFRTCAIAVCLLSALPAYSAEYFVAPLAAKATQGNGSRAKPWASVKEAFQSGDIHAGDTVTLMPGFHGALELSGQRFSRPVEILGKDARFSAIKVTKSENLTFKGLFVWPNKGDKAARSLIETGPNAANIVFNAMRVQGAEDAANYRDWSKAKWTSIKSNGVRLNGPGNSLTDSTIMGTTMAVTTIGDKTKVLRNQIRGFRADAMRGLGSGSRFIGNVITDCVKIDKNHDDAFQSWSLKDKDGHAIPVVDLRVEDNVIVEWSGPANHPLRCTLQGIVVFDGIQHGLKIRNNLVAISAYHGISVYGGQGIEIENNTVVNALGVSGGRPWVGLFERKGSKTKPTGATVAENIAPKFVNQSDDARVMRKGGNVLAQSPARGFLDVLSGDFRHWKDGVLGKQSGVGFKITPKTAPNPFKTE